MKSLILGNGIDIQFGGKAYTSPFILMRIINNAGLGKYDALFDGVTDRNVIVRIFNALKQNANNILDGKYDNCIADDGLKAAILDFRQRFSDIKKIEKTKEIPLEDWFLLIQLFFIENPDISDQKKYMIQAIERLALDAIFNEGKIQMIYKSMNNQVRKYFLSFDTIFTLNYDNNIELLCGKEVFHLHGDFSALADSENPKTCQGFYRNMTCKTVVVPGFEHAFCNALLNYCGEEKYKQAMNCKKFSEITNALREQKRTDYQSYEKNIAELQRISAESVQWVNMYCEHPDLIPCSDYHFSDLHALEGEVHLLGMSAKNDAHVFRQIEESKVEKIVFYYNSKIPKSLPISKEVEFRSAKELWKELNAEQKHYNCKVNIPNTPEVEEYIEVLNALSSDPITRKDIIEQLQEIPQYVGDQLCKEAELLIKMKENLSNEAEWMESLEIIRHIALREGIYPAAFFLLLIQYIGKHKPNRT